MVDTLVTAYDKWLRIQLCILQIGKGTILLQKLHEELPKDSEKLHSRLSTDKTKLLKYLSESHRDIFNGDRCYSQTLSLDLCQKLAHCYEMYGKPKKHSSKNGIDKLSQLQKLVDLNRDLNNETMELTDKTFQVYFNNMENIFRGLDFHDNLDDYGSKSFRELQGNALKNSDNAIYFTEALRSLVLLKQKIENANKKYYEDLAEQLYTEMKNLAIRKEKNAFQSAEIGASESNWEDGKLKIYNTDQTDQAVRRVDVSSNEKAKLNAQDAYKNDHNKTPAPTGLDETRNYIKNSTFFCDTMQCDENVYNYTGCKTVLQPTSDTTDLLNSLPSVPNEMLLTDEEEKIRLRLCLEDIPQSRIDALANTLDANGIVHIGNNYVALAKKMGISNRDITFLKLSQAGGGCPAFAFFENLKTRYGSKEVTEITDIFDSDGKFPDDISDGLNDIKLVRDIPHETQLELAIKLTSREVGNIKVSDWKTLAGELDYTQSEIDAIELAKAQDARYSPTERLFEILRLQQPELKLVTLSNLLKEIGNNKAYNIITKFMNDKVKKEIKKKKKNHIG